MSSANWTTFSLRVQYKKSLSQEKTTKRKCSPAKMPAKRTRADTEEPEPSPSQVVESPSCIDLTNDDDDVVVDLTSINESAPVVLTCSSSNQSSSAANDSVVEVDGRCPSPNLPFFDLRSRPKTSTLPPSPELISCPICLDPRSEILKSSRTLMSTVCGHIFCDVCLKEAVKSNRCCPKCRKKLTVRQIHPIFV